ncbi:amidohydrolase family protein [Chloroflexota bacterium]
MIFDIRLRPPELMFKYPEKFFGKMMTGYDAKHSKGYEAVFGGKIAENVLPYRTQPEKWLSALDDAGVTKALIISNWSPGVNEVVADYIKKYPGRFIGGISVDCKGGMAAVRELELAAKELGLKCLSLRPFRDEMYANDKRFYPIYAKCVELGITVSSVVGMNFSEQPVLDYARPIYLDEVAATFPGLKIIATHVGWPWATEMVAAAWKNRNVYIDISGVAPRFFNRPGTGYEPILNFGNSVLQDRIIWGTDWPMMDWKESLSQVDQLPLKESVKKKWLWDNAIAALALE